MKTAGEIFDDTFQPIETDDVMKYKKDIIQAMEEYADEVKKDALRVALSKEYGKKMLMLLALEYGYKSCEKGNNIDKTVDDFEKTLLNPKD